MTRRSLFRRGKKVQVRVDDDTMQRIRLMIERGVAADVSDYLRQALAMKLELDSRGENSIVVDLTPEMIKEMTLYLKTKEAKTIRIENFRDLILYAVRGFLSYNRPSIIVASRYPIFINLYERYFVTICTHKPAIAFKWRELLTYLRQKSRAVKVMMHASYRQDGSLREAYLTAITASYIYIIGKFINTVTSELELQTTLSLIKQLGISVEVREEGDPSYSQIRELFEYAERVESTQPKYTLEEVKYMHYLSEE
jgi:hypothetical protein